MAELKTKRNKGELNNVPDEKKWQDSFTILELKKQVTGKPCRYIKKVDDIEQNILKELVKNRWNIWKKQRRTERIFFRPRPACRCQALVAPRKFPAKLETISSFAIYFALI